MFKNLYISKLKLKKLFYFKKYFILFKKIFKKNQTKVIIILYYL